jgi:hypothetical protein
MAEGEGRGSGWLIQPPVKPTSEQHSHQGEASGIGDGGGGASERDDAVFQRLTEGRQGVTAELGQLVEEKDTVVGEAHLPRAGDAAAADEAGVGNTVMERAEGRRQRRAWPAGRRPAMGGRAGGLKDFLEAEQRRMEGSRLASIILPAPPRSDPSAPPSPPFSATPPCVFGLPHSLLLLAHSSCLAINSRDTV